MAAKNRQKSNAGEKAAAGSAAAPVQKKEEKPQKSNGGPQKSNGGPQKSSPGPQKSSPGPQKSNGGPQKSSGGAQKSNGGAQKSNGGPQKSSTGPQKSSTGPQKSSTGPQKSSGVSGSAAAQGSARSSGKKSGSCLGTLFSMLFYAAMIGGVVLAAFHLQKVVEEIRQTSAKHAESAQMSADVSSKMEGVVQQVASLKGVVDGLQSSLGATRVGLEGAVTRMARGEEETRQVEEALQKLQKDLLGELSGGISEMKEARQRDFSALETTVEQRLEEVSRSVHASVSEFALAQEEAQSQLAELKARLGGIEDPAMVKQELSAIVDVVAEIRAAKREADASAESIREQINSVREELRTRSQEVASLSLEVESFRAAVQDTVGSLKMSVSAAESQVQALGGRTDSLEGGLERAAEGVRGVETKLTEVAAQTRKRADDLEARLKASEESGESVGAKVEWLLTRESAQGGKELQSLNNQMEELQASVAVVGEAQDSLAATDSLMARRVEELERLAADGAEQHAAKMEEQQQTIVALQAALQEASQTLAALSQE